MKKLIDIYRNTNQVTNDAIDRIIVEIHFKKQKDGFIIGKHHSKGFSGFGHLPEASVDARPD